MTSDRRLIEDFIPIREISIEAAREKSIRKGHVPTLHLWWARRPLVAARAAVYASGSGGSRLQLELGDRAALTLLHSDAGQFEFV